MQRKLEEPGIVEVFPVLFMGLLQEVPGTKKDLGMIQEEKETLVIYITVKT